MTLFFKRPGRPPFFQDPEELQDLFMDYIEWCIENSKLASTAGFRANKAISRNILFEYEGKELYKDTFLWMKDILEDSTLNDTNIDSGTKKLILTNKFGYQDKTSVDQRNMNLNVDAIMSEEETTKLLEELKQKYLPNYEEDDILE